MTEKEAMRTKAGKTRKMRGTRSGSMTSHSLGMASVSGKALS